MNQRHEMESSRNHGLGGHTHCGLSALLKQPNVFLWYIVHQWCEVCLWSLSEYELWLCCKVCIWVWGDLEFLWQIMQYFASVLPLTWKVNEGNGYILYTRQTILCLPQTMNIRYQKLVIHLKSCKSNETNYAMLNSNANLGGSTSQ